MDARKVVNGHLAVLGSELGLDGLALDDDGIVNFRFAEKVLTSVALQDDSSFLLFSPLLTPDVEAMRTALKANFLWADTDGATLAIEPETGQLAIHKRVPLDGLEYPAFHAALDAFIETASQFLELFGPTAAADGAPTDLKFDLRQMA